MRNILKVERVKILARKEDTMCPFHQRFTYSFYARRSQKRKKIQLSHQYLFMILGSLSVKAVRRTLMKLSQGDSNRHVHTCIHRGTQTHKETHFQTNTKTYTNTNTCTHSHFINSTFEKIQLWKTFLSTPCDLLD